MVSHSTQATASSTKGFTLVELIVVITILAILGTIGFLSLQGYSASARDSKRTSDVRSLLSVIGTKNTEGLGLISLVNSTTATSELTGGPTNGVGGVVLNTSDSDYTAGIPNFTVLGLSSVNFKDGVNDYRIGTTTRAGGVYQVAATLEGSGVKSALVSGNYNSRGALTIAATGTPPAVAVNTVFSITLPSPSVGLVKKWDIFALGTPTGKIKINSVANDGLSATVTVTTALGSLVTLSGVMSPDVADSAGLIAKLMPTADATTAVTNGSTANLPY